MNALQPLHDLLGFHTFDKTAYALGVAVAASIKLNIVNGSINDFELNYLTTSALGAVSVFHKSIIMDAKITEKSCIFASS
jgi:hypothetical protein